MKKLFVVDASGYLYSAYFAIRNMTNSKGESTNALFGFLRSLNKLIKDFSPSHLVAVFDGPYNAKNRIAIYPEYKAHRQSTPLDLRYQIERARVYCDLIGIPQLSEPEVEADDTIGSIALWAKDLDSHVYLCSTDKDLCQLVNGKVSILNTYKDNLIIGPQQVEETYGVPPHLIVDYLAIIGDASDNVPGLPGFGPKTAAKLLQKYGSLDNLLANAAEISEPKKRDTLLQEKDLALLSRRLVTIETSVEIPKDPAFFALREPHVEDLREFYKEMNFKTLLLELEQRKLTEQLIQPSETICTLIDSEPELENFFNVLRKQNFVCLRTISTHPNPFKAQCLGVAFATGSEKQNWYLPLNGLLDRNKILTDLKAILENPALICCGHDIKNDIQVFANLGIEIASVGFDTLLASYLLNSHTRQQSLENIVLEHFGRAKTSLENLLGKGKATQTIDKIEPKLVCPYICEEVDYISQLHSILEKQIAERNLSNLFFELELPLIKVLASMERYGIFLNLPFIENLASHIRGEISLITEEIYALAGEMFNINSPKQLIAIFEKLQIRSFKKTPTGQMRTDSGVLEEMKDRYPIAKKILEYRTLEKLRSTYVETLPQEIHPASARIHCTFNQFVAATGRLSCQNPNLQNIPVRTEIGRQIREAFCPQHDGWSYLAADYSQIELRLLAHFSEDPHLLRAFQNHEDVHLHTASIIFDVPLSLVTKEMRYQAKAVNFGIIYGQQAFGLAQELGIDVKTAAEIIDMYFRRYSRVQEFIESCKETARQTGKATTLTGRERLIPEILSKNIHLRQAAERLAMNTPLQGTAADLIKMAMLKMQSAFPCHLKPLSPPEQKGMVLQIHDELIFEVPNEEIEKMKKFVRDTMEGVVELKIPLIVDLAVGKNWKEC